MDNYVTGATIKALREKKKLTQAQLAERIAVSDKAVSKWETGKGLPDITLLEPLAAALGVSVTELISGETVINRNRSANILRSRLYVCPVCGNAVFSVGEAAISCCGVTLPPLEAEEPDAEHDVKVEHVDGELYVSSEHEMTRDHYISFFAFVNWERAEIIKRYPEGGCDANIANRGGGILYWYCNRHGLFKKKI